MTQDLEPLKAAFAKSFLDWGVTLPDDAVRERRPGHLKQPNGSGSARYAWGRNDRGEYVEFYAFHRIWGDHHARIYADGETEWLPALTTMYAVEQDDPEGTERNRQEMAQENRKLLAQLEAAGLLSGGAVPVSFTINAHLVTTDEPPKGDQDPNG